MTNDQQTPASYTPATIARMREMARKRASLRAVAGSLGWDVERTARIAKTHGIELAGATSPSVASSHDGIVPQ